METVGHVCTDVISLPRNCLFFSSAHFKTFRKQKIMVWFTLTKETFLKTPSSNCFFIGKKVLSLNALKIFIKINLIPEVECNVDYPFC